jgi:hypothetical protein
MIHRRSFLRGLIAAPAIVAAHNIMPVKLLVPDAVHFDFRGYSLGFTITREALLGNLYKGATIPASELYGIKWLGEGFGA